MRRVSIGKSKDKNKHVRGTRRHTLIGISTQHMPSPIKQTEPRVLPQEADVKQNEAFTPKKPPLPQIRKHSERFVFNYQSNKSWT